MKVLNLECMHGHAFEGWFASEDEFQSQREGSLIACPLCSDTAVTKRLSAPRLNLGRGGGAPERANSGVAPESDGGAASEVAALPRQAMQAAWMQMVRRVMAQTEDVGERFAEEARRMHYLEVPERPIRGEASLEEYESLKDEGIEVILLPLMKKEKTH